MNQKGRIYFVSGIDTGIGKSIATGLMARNLMARGIDVITVKMVQTGNDGYSEDLQLHRQMCGGVHFPEDDAGLTAPQIFKFPSSPLLAASLEQRTVDIDAIRHAVDECAARHQVVLVESAGGLHVPLSSGLLSIDLASQQHWPLILVTCGRLGSINHTLLSLEAAISRRMAIAGIVYNWHSQSDPLIDADTPEYTLQYLRRLGHDLPMVRIPQLVPGLPDPEIDFTAIIP